MPNSISYKGRGTNIFVFLIKGLLSLHKNVCIVELLGNYNNFHNILRRFDVLPNFPFTASEKMCDYYLYTWYIRVASQVAELLKT